MEYQRRPRGRRTDQEKRRRHAPQVEHRMICVMFGLRRQQFVRIRLHRTRHDKVGGSGLNLDFTFSRLNA